ncbi:Carbonic anhydrase [Phytophthora megakarya]|uniref:carbonic anhydrase n=1 Tax=Phytophthora megakarya TaxID=4795 RepID=A0A225WCM9_9STRA|nr:Carbonic anhydrase [Phytophthora megakarya]
MGASISKVSISKVSIPKVLHHKTVAVATEKPVERPSMLSQSPIDITEDPAEEVETLSSSETELQLGSALAEMKLVHGGENFQVTWSNREQNVLMLNGKKYYTVQFHFHSPSEHTVNGNARAMELHLVHQAEDGSLAVVGVFFTEGKENAFLAQFWDEIATLNKKHDHVALGKIVGGDELNNLLDGKIYRYQGSLTTPPYSEGVEWVVVSDMLEASPEQLELYRKFLPSPNARDTQKINGRKISPCQCSNITPIAA